MSEKISTNNNSEYTENHPNAVQDAEKAHFMAEVMDVHETRAAELRKSLAEGALAAADQTESYHHGQPLVEMGVAARNGYLAREIKDQNELSDRKANDAASIYDVIQDTKR